MLGQCANGPHIALQTAWLCIECAAQTELVLSCIAAVQHRKSSRQYNAWSPSNSPPACAAMWTARRSSWQRALCARCWRWPCAQPLNWRISGIYRSANGGQQWDSIAAPAPSGFGFAVVCDPSNPLRAWFVPAQADACRIPVDGRMVVARTDDGGQSFKAFSDGPPQSHAYHLAYRHGLDVTADGRTLAMASTTGGLWAIRDAGEHWHCVSSDLPPVAAVRFAP